MGFVAMETELNSHRMHKPEEELHAPSKRLKVDHVIQRTLLPDVPKHGHANNGIYERYERQEGADIEKSWQ
jgi:hypothetical protein